MSLNTNFFDVQLIKKQTIMHTIKDVNFINMAPFSGENSSTAVIPYCTF